MFCFAHDISIGLVPEHLKQTQRSFGSGKLLVFGTITRRAAKGHEPPKPPGFIEKARMSHHHACDIGQYLRSNKYYRLWTGTIATPCQRSCGFAVMRQETLNLKSAGLRAEWSGNSLLYSTPVVDAVRGVICVALKPRRASGPLQYTFVSVLRNGVLWQNLAQANRQHYHVTERISWVTKALYCVLEAYSSINRDEIVTNARSDQEIFSGPRPMT